MTDNNRDEHWCPRYRRGCRRRAEHAPPFVGRDAELQELRQAWGLAVAGNRQIVLVSGDPGIGKTTLANELADEVRAAGGWVLTGSAPPGRAVPYAPMVDALTEAARSAPLDVLVRRPLLAHVVPEIGARIAGQPPFPQDREQLFWDAAGLLGDLSDVAPVLLILDDLHRADRSTVRMLQYVLPRTGDCPMLVIAAYCDTSVDRADPFSALLTQLLADRGIRHLVLPGIARARGARPPPLAGGARRGLDEVRGQPPLPRRAAAPRRPVPADGRPPHAAPLGGAGRDPPAGPPRRRHPPAARRGLAHRPRVHPRAGGRVGRGALEPDRPPPPTRRSTPPSSSPSSGPPATSSPTRSSASPSSAGSPCTAACRSTARSASRWRTSRSSSAVDVARLAFHSAAAAPVGGSMSAARYAAQAGDQAMDVLAYDEAAGWYGQALGLVTGHRPRQLRRPLQAAARPGRRPRPLGREGQGPRRLPGGRRPRPGPRRQPAAGPGARTRCPTRSPTRCPPSSGPRPVTAAAPRPPARLGDPPSARSRLRRPRSPRRPRPPPRRRIDSAAAADAPPPRLRPPHPEDGVRGPKPGRKRGPDHDARAKPAAAKPVASRSRPGQGPPIRRSRRRLPPAGARKSRPRTWPRSPGLTADLAESADRSTPRARTASKPRAGAAARPPGARPRGLHRPAGRARTCARARLGVGRRVRPEADDDLGPREPHRRRATATATPGS